MAGRVEQVPAAVVALASQVPVRCTAASASSTINSSAQAAPTDRCRPISASTSASVAGTLRARGFRRA